MMRTLAIAMPMRNRAATVKKNILGILDELRQYNVKMYLSDDSSNDETQELISSLQSMYSGIVYSRNIPPKGHDLNCLKIISEPDSDYVWYIGDSMIIRKGAIKAIFDIIQTSDPSFIFINRQYCSLHLGNSSPISDFQAFIDDNIWHLTLTSATVYSRKALENGLQDFCIADSANFAQLGIIMNAIRNGCNDGYWMQKCLTKTDTAGTKSYWKKRTIPIFAGDWVNMIQSYSDIFSKEMLLDIMKSHSRKTGMLGFFSMCKLGLGHGLGVEAAKYYDELCLSSSLPESVIRLFVRPVR